MAIITFKHLQLDCHAGNPAPLSRDLNLPPSHFPPPPPSLSACLSSAPSSSLMNTERRIKYSWRRQRARARGGRGTRVHNWLAPLRRLHFSTRKQECVRPPPRREPLQRAGCPSKFNAVPCPAHECDRGWLLPLHLFLLLNSQPLKFNLGDVERIYFIGPFAGTCIFTLPKYLKHLHIPGTRRASV